MNWHLLSLPEIFKLLKVSPEGLTKDEADERVKENGSNTLTDYAKKSILNLLIHQFYDWMVFILLCAAIISGILGDKIDTIIIFCIIFLNAMIGFIQEFKAEKAMESLKKMTTSSSRVIRNKAIQEINSIDLVVGDIVLLEAGNVIPADVRFLETFQLKVDESTLTGESNHIDKVNQELPEGDYMLGDRINLGFKGTHVSNGRAKAIVVATGMQTEIGKIARLIQTGNSETPLQKRLKEFSKKLTYVILLICLVIFTIGWLRGENAFEMMMTSISLAVAAIPEALPALVTIALALGAKKLVKKNALVRNLHAVETLGSVNYICTDKTGTLTENKMKVDQIYPIEFQHNLESIPMDRLLDISLALNNDIEISPDGSYLGDSTEVALLKHAEENGFRKNTLSQEFPRIAEIPFDSTRKCMTTIHQCQNKYLVITKGAIDVLIDKIPSSQLEDKIKFQTLSNEYALKGYRVLGVAVKILNQFSELDINHHLEEDNFLIGIIGLIDPPRKEVKNAIEESLQAGIHPVMITGDHPLTANAIAFQLGILKENNSLYTITGTELAKINDEQLASKIEAIRVYARVNPDQKLRIVNMLKDKGHFVAMTGDGVNDAPALKNATIGIAMGINGTEVSKEAAHMILLDDNYSTILTSVRHGRRIFDNILKFIKYIMSGNAGEIWAIFLAPLLGLPVPILPIHILWVNLITDGLPGLALASEKEETNIMQISPRKANAPIFSKSMVYYILWVGLFIGLLTIGTQYWALQQKIENWQTMTFTVLCFSQLFNVLSIRSQTKTIFSIGFLSNKTMVVALVITIALQLSIIYIPFFNHVFKTNPLSMFELLVTVAISSMLFFALELNKLLRTKF